MLLIHQLLRVETVTTKGGVLHYVQISHCLSFSLAPLYFFNIWYATKVNGLHLIDLCNEKSHCQKERMLEQINMLIDALLILFTMLGFEEKELFLYTAPQPNTIYICSKTT